MADRAQLDSKALGYFSGIETNSTFHLWELTMAEEHKTNKTCRNMSNTIIEKCTESVKMRQKGL